MADNTPGRLAFKKLLGFRYALLSLAGFTNLRNCPGRRGNCPRQMNTDVTGLKHCDPVGDPRARFHPIALEKVRHSRRKMRPADGKSMLRGFSNADRLRLVLGGLGKSAELGKTHNKPGAIEDRRRHGHAEIFVVPVGR